MRLRVVVRASLWAILVLGGFGMSTAIDADCNWYYNSRPYYTSHGTYCSSTGSGCAECVDDEGNSCATNGSSCTPRHQT